MENNQQFKWINIVLNQLSKVEENQAKAVVENCGRECLKSSGRIEKINILKKEISDRNNKDLLFAKYKEKIYDNSPNLYKSENDYYLEYEECGCGMVTEGDVSDPFLCNCTIGYTKETFETLFDEKVEVVLQKSILRGDDICKQKISINPE